MTSGSVTFNFAYQAFTCTLSGTLTPFGQLRDRGDDRAHRRRAVGVHDDGVADLRDRRVRSLTLEYKRLRSPDGGQLHRDDANRIGHVFQASGFRLQHDRSLEP